MITEQTIKLASQVKRILESEERSYMSKENKEDIYKNVMNKKLTLTEQAAAMQIRQEDVDRAEFEYYYDKWYAETCIHSNLNIVYNNEYFKKIEKMGRRAIPFIYEKLSGNGDFVVGALETIYQEGVARPKQFIGLKNYCSLWRKKIEEEGDI